MPFHTPPKYFVYLAKSHTNKNDTLKFPNEPQLRNSSLKLAWNTPWTWPSYLTVLLILPGHMKPVIISAKIR